MKCAPKCRTSKRYLQILPKNWAVSGMAVERNEAIVPRSAYEATRLEPGDSLEIVHFIGGG